MKEPNPLLTHNEVVERTARLCRHVEDEFEVLVPNEPQVLPFFVDWLVGRIATGAPSEAEAATGLAKLVTQVRVAWEASRKDAAERVGSVQ